MPYFSTGGQFGGGMQNPNFGNWGGTPWDQSWWQNPNPQAAIQGQTNDITRNMNSNFNAAANRLGQGGMLGGSSSARAGNSSPYQNALGGAATDASRQMADVVARYNYDAQQQTANRGLTAQQSAADLWNSQQNRNLSWAQQQSSQGANAQTDWWNRYYNSLLQGGSPEYMQNWQQGGLPYANQYAQTFTATPWSR